MVENFEDLRQTDEWAKYLRLIGWANERIRNQELGIRNYLYIKKFPLLPWSVAKLQRANNVDEEQLQKACKKHKVIKLIKHETVAKTTIWIDLKKSEKRLLSEMKSKTRYNIGLAKRRGVKIKVIKGSKVKRLDLNTLDLIYGLIVENAKRLKIFKMPKKWFEAKVRAFGDKCFGVVARKNGELVAGNMFYCSPTVCFYAESGSTAVGRKLMAPSWCVWEGMMEAKKRNLKIFDFDGIWDGSRSLKRWQGFSRFKQGFGGKVVTF